MSHQIKTLLKQIRRDAQRPIHFATYQDQSRCNVCKHPLDAGYFVIQRPTGPKFDMRPWSLCKACYQSCLEPYDHSDQTDSCYRALFHCIGIPWPDPKHQRTARSSRQRYRAAH